MSHFHFIAGAVAPIRSAGVLALALALAGCASTAPDHLDAQRNSVVRQLATQCYWQHEGARALYGGLRVYTACRGWAHRQVQVSMPGPH